MPYQSSDKTRQKKDAKRTAMMQAAVRVFSAKGYHAATIRDIVSEAEVAVGTFYFYFPDKETLFVHLYEETAQFLLQAIQVRPDLIGLSGLLTSSYDAMKETIDLIRMTGDPEINSIPIVIGGNQLNDQVSKYVGADYWLNDAMSGVRLCQQLLHSEQQEN